MQRDGEGPLAIARVLATRRAVARWRGDALAMRELADAARAPAPVYSYPATARRSRRRIAGAVALAVAAAGIIVFHPWLGGTTLAIAAVAAMSAVRTLVARSRRFDLHAAWAQLGIHSRAMRSQP